MYFHNYYKPAKQNNKTAKSKCKWPLITQLELVFNSFSVCIIYNFFKFHPAWVNIVSIIRLWVSFAGNFYWSFTTKKKYNFIDLLLSDQNLNDICDGILLLELVLKKYSNTYYHSTHVKQYKHSKISIQDQI